MYKKLRAKLLERGYEHSIFCKKVGMCPASFSARMNGHLQWQLGEMYAVLRLLGEPPEKLHEYFPPEEKQERAARNRPVVQRMIVD